MLGYHPNDEPAAALGHRLVDVNAVAVRLQLDMPVAVERPVAQLRFPSRPAGEIVAHVRLFGSNVETQACKADLDQLVIGPCSQIKGRRICPGRRGGAAT